LPSKIKVNPGWQTCGKDRDCIIVDDCCGIVGGYKYTINEFSGAEWGNFMSNWCRSKDHRMGCGWKLNDYAKQPRCINSTCVLTYGGMDVDNLTDHPIYNWSWVKGNLQ